MGLPKPTMNVPGYPLCSDECIRPLVPCCLLSCTLSAMPLSFAWISARIRNSKCSRSSRETSSSRPAAPPLGEGWISPPCCGHAIPSSCPASPPSAGGSNRSPALLAATAASAAVMLDVRSCRGCCSSSSSLGSAVPRVGSLWPPHSAGTLNLSHALA